MSAEIQQPAASVSDSSGTDSRGSVVPIWLIILTFMLLYWGALYFDKNGGWFSANVYAPYRSMAELDSYTIKAGGNARGRQLFNMICALCHGADGAGTSQAPPLAGSEWATGSPNRMIRIPLVGLSGPIEAAGKPFNGNMGPLGAGLPDEDLAAILSYIRESFGNKAEPITPEQVAKVRAEVKTRTVPFTVPEIQGIQ